MEQHKTGTLYLCATPIGNLEDITYRVLRTLKEVDLIAAEDTRNSIRLLNHFEIKTPMTSYHEYNKIDKAYQLVAKMREGKNIALITDAGTPGISDPGEDIVRICYEEGIPVMLNPAPYMDIPEEWIEKVTYLTPNEHEAALMFEGMDRDEILKAHAGKVIMTVGKEGVVYGDGDDVVHASGFTVSAVDTTGAGDTFNGAFAAARCDGLPLKEAVRFANAAAALSVQKIGAQGGMPWRSEVEEMLS